MARGMRPTTTTEWVDDFLREAILTRRFAPGDKLVLSTLAVELGVSPTPLREAIARLAVDGLVELTPHGSARVASVSRAEVLEIYDLRCLNEPWAFRTAIEAATDEDRQSWQRAFDRLASSEVPIENLQHHAAFHRSLISSCPSRWMLRTLVPLQDHALRIVAATAPELPANYDVKADHEPLLRLALDGAADEAAEVLFEHLDRTRRSIADHPAPTAEEATA